MAFKTSTRNVNILKGVHRFYAGADGTINANRLVYIHANGDYLEAPANEFGVIGVNFEGRQRSDGENLVLAVGALRLIAAQAVEAGRALKSYHGGRAGLLVTAALVGQDILAATAGGNFGNQPANDGVEVVSSSAADTTQSVTIYGTTNGGDVVVVETVALNGTTPVATTKVNWGEILGVELSAVCAGTITIREASGDLGITTIAPAALQAGVAYPSAANQRALAQAPTAVAGGASTKKVGLVGTGVDGAVLTNNAKTLNGATAIIMPTKMNTVTKVLLGDVASASTVQVDVGAADDAGLKIGKSLTAAATLGDTFWAVLHP